MIIMTIAALWFTLQLREGHQYSEFARSVQASFRKDKPILAVAIDFGTTYSGYAFSLKADYESNPTKILTKSWIGSTLLVSHKEPTCVLIESDGKTARAFGYDAESIYAEDPQRNSLYLFRRFKMLLDTDAGLNKDVVVKDVQGKSLPAITVFSLSIRCLMADLDARIGKGLEIASLKPSEVIWVLTVPAIWNNAAKQFMREAAIQAGISDTYLKIALEPEAAALFCRHLPHGHFRGEYVNLSSLPTGEQYMVLDAGGGTVDITIHEVVGNRTVKEVEAANGGSWGGVTVDQIFFKFLESITGPGFLDKLRDCAFQDEIELVQYFEIQKRKISPYQTKPVIIPIPLMSFNEICHELFNEDFTTRLMNAGLGGKVILKQECLVIHADVFKQFFDSAIQKITDHVSDLLGRLTVFNCNHIIMVGGFSECMLLQEAIKKTCSAQKVITPLKAGLMVLKGAVVFGHEQKVISQHISKYTYGTDIYVPFNENEHPISKLLYLNGECHCIDIFLTIVKAGDILKVDHPSEPVRFVLLDNKATEMKIKIFVAKGEAPKFVTDDACRFVCQISVPLVQSDSQKIVEVRVVLQGKRLKVECKYLKTGTITSSFINILQ